MESVYVMRVAQAARLCAAHALLFTFTLLLARKLDLLFSGAWWLVFCPLWLFHVVVARWRFSIPAPSGLHEFHWPPFHASVATPMLFAFELLLCVHLEISHAVNWKVVFFPVVLLGILIILDNLRMWVSLKLEDTGDSSVNVKWKEITHCSIILSMAFIIVATMIMVQMLSDDTATRNWWLPYFVFSIGQFFAFLVCTKWTYPVIDRYSQTSTTNDVAGEEGEGEEGDEEEDDDDEMLDRYSQTSTTTDVVGEEGDGEGEEDDDQMLGNKGSLQDIGGHAMKALIVAFQVLVCMRVQGTPAIAREIPFQIIFSPLLLLQGAGVVVSTLLMFEIMANLPPSIRASNERYYTFCPKARDFLEFILRGSRLLGWWSLNELEPRVLHDNASGYTFFDTPPSAVEKMSKKDLAEEVWTLQVEYNGLIEAAKSSKLKRDLLQKNEVLCRICTNKEVEVLLYPCKHWNLCRSCCIGRRVCPICHCRIEREYILGKVYQKLLL